MYLRHSNISSALSATPVIWVVLAHLLLCSTSFNLSSPFLAAFWMVLPLDSTVAGLILEFIFSLLLLFCSSVLHTCCFYLILFKIIPCFCFTLLLSSLVSLSIFFMVILHSWPIWFASITHTVGFGGLSSRQHICGRTEREALLCVPQDEVKNKSTRRALNVFC